MNDNKTGKTISILGCGWLGWPLAKKLVTNGWPVKGSTTTPEKLSLLKETGIEPFLVQAEAIAKADSAFFDSSILLINVPPGRKTAPNGYSNKMQQLLSAIRDSIIQKVIFISSTSVYGDVCREVTEADEPDNLSELLQAEMLFLSAKNLHTTVIRFGGLLGPDRNPGRFFRDKNSISDGLSPVNLIHLDDCLGVIEAILNQPEFSGTINAVAPSHPTKKEFYTKAILNSGFPAPEFVEEKKNWKIISPQKLITSLNYQFKYPDLLTSLDDPDAF